MIMFNIHEAEEEKRKIAFVSVEVIEMEETVHLLDNLRKS